MVAAPQARLPFEAEALQALEQRVDPFATKRPWMHLDHQPGHPLLKYPRLMRSQVGIATVDVADQGDSAKPVGLEDFG